MKEEFIGIGVAFVPPESAKDLAVKLSAEISQKSEAYFVLDGKNFYPHITIYAPEFPAKNLDKVLFSIEELSKQISSVRFSFTKMMPEFGWIGVESKLSEEIKNIHIKIVQLLNPLHEGHLREKYLSETNDIANGEQDNIKLYGHPHVIDLYRPHLTLIRLKDKKAAEKIAGEIDWPLKEFTLDKIGVFKMGDHGTCVELIKEFNLG
jgi:2'-5' RNA ligase